MQADTCRTCGFSPLSDSVRVRSPGGGGLFDDRSSDDAPEDRSHAKGWCNACEGARSLSRWLQGGRHGTWSPPQGTMVAWMPEMTQAYASIVGKVAMAIPHVKARTGQVTKSGTRSGREDDDRHLTRFLDDLDYPSDDDHTILSPRPRADDSEHDFPMPPASDGTLTSKAQDGAMSLMDFVRRRSADAGLAALARRLPEAPNEGAFVTGLRVFDRGECGSGASFDDHLRTTAARRWLEQGTLMGLTHESIARTGAFRD